MVQFELIINLNNNININENSINIAALLNKASLKNVIMASNIIVFENEMLNVTINPSFCSLNFKVEIDWIKFSEYLNMIGEIIKYLSSSNFSPIINIHLIKIIELNNDTFANSLKKTKFDYTNPIFKDLVGVGYRFLEKTKDGLINETKVEPLIRDRKYLYIESYNLYKTFEDINEYCYINFEERINYFRNEFL